MKILAAISTALLLSVNVSAAVVTHTYDREVFDESEVSTTLDDGYGNYFGEFYISQFFQMSDVFGSTMVPTSGEVVVTWGYSGELPEASCSTSDGCRFDFVSSLRGTDSSGATAFSSFDNRSLAPIDGAGTFNFSRTEATFDAIEFYNLFQNGGEIFSRFTMTSPTQDGFAFARMTNFVETSFAGSFTEVPAPAGLAIFSLGLVALLRRRAYLLK